MASHETDDEFGDDQSFEYNEAFESQLRIIEFQQAIVATEPNPPRYVPIDPSADRASATRRKLEHLDISLESQAGDRDLVDELVGEDDQELLDVLNISGSQASKYEEELVQQVTQLIPAAGNGSSGSSTEAHVQHTSEATEDHATRDISLVRLVEGEETGTRKRSLFQKFRKRGFFSVTDLVAPSWCEVQFDYRLRSKSYLPVAARPDTIQTSTGSVIVLNKEIAGTGEKIMRKGEQVHKKLEREIHPVEVEVKTDSREDVWGLRFLNMLASLEALMTLGKCRELPVVGFVRGYMLVGVIDEITRKPLVTYTKKRNLTASPQASADDLTVCQTSSLSLDTIHSAKSVKSSSKSTGKGKTSDGPRPSPQKTLFAFYRPLRPRSAAPPKVSYGRTHVLYVSDSKTRAAGTMPKEENSNNGKMQLMLYKEMLDSMVVEGLRQYARDERSPLSAQNASADEVEVVGERLEDEVVCIDEDEDEVAAIKPKEASPLLEGKLSGKVSTSTDSAIDPFTWQDLFDHLALDASQPFTETFLAQSRPLIEGNSLSATVAGARNLQQMTRCWAEYTSRLGLGTIDPNLDDAGIEEALDKETGGRKIGRSEKLLSLVYRRVGKSTKMKARRTQSATDNGRVKERSNGKKRRKRGKGALDDVEAVPSLSIEESSRGEGVATTDSPPIQSLNAMEVEEERTLQLAIAESLSIPLEFSEFKSRGSKIEGPCPDTSAGDEEQLPESLLPRRSSTEDVKQYPTQPGPLQSESSDTVEPARFINSEQSSPSPAEVAEAPGTDGSIIGSHRFAYSSTLLADHIERILQFWTGAREPVGVTIENTSRCGWCEFEDGCEWRAAKAMEAISKNEALKSARRSTIT